MDPFEEYDTEKEIDDKLEELARDGQDITNLMTEQAAKRKLQIRSRAGQYQICYYITLNRKIKYIIYYNISTNICNYAIYHFHYKFLFTSVCFSFE